MKKFILPILIILIGIIFYEPTYNNLDNKPEIKYYEVNITGEVLRPGNYKVPEKTTVRKAVDMAGRTNKSIFIDNDEYINKNTKINVLKREKSIDLNKATKEELMSIPTIGEKKAIKIMQYRREQRITSYVEIKELLNINSNDTLLKIMANTVIK